MALQIGPVTASSGMSQAIYAEMDQLLSPPLVDAVDQAEGDAKEVAQNALDEPRIGWQKLSHAISKGVIEHLLANLEVHDVQTRGEVSVSVDGATAQNTPPPLAHAHPIQGQTGTQSNVTFDQVEGTGTFA